MNYIKPGKHTKAWNRERAKLKVVYAHKGITTCEIDFEHICTRDNFLGFAHKHKRIFYRSHPELLGDFNQTILACTNGHNIIEHDKEVTREVFRILRPDGLELE